MASTIARLGTDIKEVELGASAFVKPRSVLYTMDGGGPDATRTTGAMPGLLQPQPASGASCQLNRITTADSAC